MQSGFRGLAWTRQERFFPQEWLVIGTLGFIVSLGWLLF
jgi:hypothetical protein